MNIPRIASSVIFTAVVAGCSVFVPSYVENADAKATAGYEELSLILAKAELGSFQEKTSYAEQVDKYADVISKFSVAKLTFSQSGEGSGPALNSARGALNSLIANCISLVGLLAREHEIAGIVPGTGATQPVQVACDAAVQAVRATR